MAESLNSKPSGQITKRITPSQMIAASVILAVLLIFLVVMYFNQKSKMIEMETILTEEKDSLANELKSMVFAYDTLKTNNDIPTREKDMDRSRL